MKLHSFICTFPVVLLVYIVVLLLAEIELKEMLQELLESKMVSPPDEIPPGGLSAA